jgi:hypothetical protein
MVNKKLESKSNAEWMPLRGHRSMVSSEYPGYREPPYSSGPRHRVITVGIESPRKMEAE